MGCWRQVRYGICYAVLLAGPLICLASDLPDPTRPLVGKVQASGQAARKASLPVLGSTWMGPDRRLAIINGKRYKENDRIGPYRLVSIEEGQVTLESGTRRLELRLSTNRRSRDKR